MASPPPKKRPTGKPQHVASKFQISWETTFGVKRSSKGSQFVFCIAGGGVHPVKRHTNGPGHLSKLKAASSQPTIASELESSPRSA